MGMTRRFVVEMFGSSGATQRHTRARVFTHFIRWGSIGTAFLFMIGYMLYEVAITVRLVEFESESQQQQALGELVNIDEMMAEHGDRIDQALRDGTVDRLLGERQVPDNLKRRIKEEIRKKRSETSPGPAQ